MSEYCKSCGGIIGLECCMESECSDIMAKKLEILHELQYYKDKISQLTYDIEQYTAKINYITTNYSHFLN